MDSVKFFSDKIEWEIRETMLLENFLKTIGFSKNLCQQSYLEGSFIYRGKKIKKNMEIVGKLIYQIPLEENHYILENIDFEIIYEDENLLVVNKPPYLTMLPPKEELKGSLANGVANYFHKQGIMRKIRFVNRLDRDTSGVVIIAKHSYIHGYLMKEMEKKYLHKSYLALVEGKMEEKGLIEKNLVRDSKDFRTRLVENGKKAKTKYQLIDYSKGISFIKVDLSTGRTHQIRAHLADLGHPVLGDALYGSKYPFPRQALHASEYIVDNLWNKKYRFFAPLFGDMMGLLDELGFEMSMRQTFAFFE